MVAACCSGLLCVAVWCSVLQSVSKVLPLNIYVCYMNIFIYTHVC